MSILEQVALAYLRRMTYIGGGYFREDANIGTPATIIHAPHYAQLLLFLIDRSRQGIPHATNTGS